MQHLLILVNLQITSHRLFSHDGKVRILNFSSKCAFELRSVHMIKILAYFELRIIHTSDRKCDSPFESVEKRHGCVWVACQSNMTCVVYVSFACAARGIIGGSG